MEWTGEGLIIGVRRHGETSVIAEVMVEGGGRHLGLVRGGRSTRLAATLQPGNSVQLTWRARGWGRLSLMHYDNHADPQAWQPYEGGERLYAWRTRFWSLGATADTGPITWLAQAMDGDTVIEPVPNLVFPTKLWAGGCAAETVVSTRGTQLWIFRWHRSPSCPCRLHRPKSRCRSRCPGS